MTDMKATHISKCCKAEVKYRARGVAVGRGIKVPYECIACGKGCALIPIIKSIE